MGERPDTVWPLQDAKQRFSEVVRAAEKAPQIVTRHGKEVAVVLDIDEYRKLQREDFVEFLLSGPPIDDELIDEINAMRDTSLSRPVELG